MNRGILVTAYASLKKEVTYEEVKAIYDAYYGKEQFVRVLDKDVCPETKWVEGSNYVDVNFKLGSENKPCDHDGGNGQSGERCSRSGRAEYEPDVWICRERRPSGRTNVPIKQRKVVSIDEDNRWRCNRCKRI